MKIIYVDEVGCASIFGPVLTCAVAININEPKVDGIRDSKKLTKKKREELYPLLQQTYEHAFGTASPKTIEKMNIFWARYEAMKIAVEKLISRGVKAKEVIVDGNFEIPNLSLPQQAVIKADDKYWEVGAASILAKVKRDSALAELAKVEKYSHYDLENNAGYYTPKHRDGIILHGPTTLHRRNFNYFKFCLFCHNQYEEFVKKGKTFEDYNLWAKAEAGGKSVYKAWRDGMFDSWKEVSYGG